MHVRVSSPPIVSPCFYGIDFADDRTQLVAAGKDVEGVRGAIGATSLAYLSLDGLQAATRRPASSFCRACLTREYPTRVPLERRLDKTRFEVVRRACRTSLLLEHAAGLRDPAADQVGGGRKRKKVIQSFAVRLSVDPADEPGDDQGQQPDAELGVARNRQAGDVADVDRVEEELGEDGGSEEALACTWWAARRGGVVAMRLLSSGGVCRNVDELELQPVGVVEEDGVVPARTSRPAGSLSMRTSRARSHSARR